MINTMKRCVKCSGRISSSRDGGYNYDSARHIRKQGSTQGIAERTAGKLRQLGKQAEARTVDEVSDPHFTPAAPASADLSLAWSYLPTILFFIY
jgi:hypothetical protein